MKLITEMKVGNDYGDDDIASVLQALICTIRNFAMMADNCAFWSGGEWDDHCIVVYEYYGKPDHGAYIKCSDIELEVERLCKYSVQWCKSRMSEEMSSASFELRVEMEDICPAGGMSIVFYDGPYQVSAMRILGARKS